MQPRRAPRVDVGRQSTGTGTADAQDEDSSAAAATPARKATTAARLIPAARSNQAVAPAFAHTVRQRTVRLQRTALQVLRCVTERKFSFRTFFTCKFLQTGRKT
ncbi:hypothetical protein LN461_09160 [Xanthomonas arboricola]|uniref:hypothetical protein n=1 Tax=Xanthomonas arboricola TaxID=56448 RepID=UPI001E608506|nr:hypothetical protein [Xanthomonas arboricola]MCC8669523.1 hypothetical protein [Xanthomonas arboricola]